MAALSSEYYPDTTSSHIVNHDGYAFVSPMMSRAESIASDGHSMVSSMTANVPSYLSNVIPAPEYISPSSASQVATESQYSSRGSISEDEEQFDHNGRVSVASGAIALVNSFLDKLLYDFLSTAKSTSLLALRPAVAEILRKSLARDAIARAQGDLEDLLALQDSDDDEKLLQTPKEAGKWNMEFIWKRSRLRVMMRSEKSEFDIDDDERYVQEQGLYNGGRRFSQSNVISLSAEIFLAGVLDFIAEQLLSHAASGAALRTRRTAINAKSDPGLQGTAHNLVQEPDIEKAALNSSMERLWRNWRKTLRGRRLSLGRRSSRSTTSSPAMLRHGSIAGVADATLVEEGGQNIPDMNHSEHVLASNIPLPMTPRGPDFEDPWTRRDTDEKVPQHHVTGGRVGHRAVNSVGNFSYFRPMGSNVHMETRPATSPQPIATPFVDAPGAWPSETPLEEPREPGLDFGDMTGLKEETFNRSTNTLLGGTSSPDISSTQMRASPVPTLDPSQLGSLPPSISIEAVGIAESKTLQGDKPVFLDVAGPTVVSTETLAPGAQASLFEGVGQRREARLSEEFKRKSIGEMRDFLAGAEDSHEKAVMGRFLEGADSEDEIARPMSKDSEYSTQSYPSIDRVATHVYAERTTSQHTPASEEYLAMIAESSPHDSPVLPLPGKQSHPVPPQKSNRRSQNMSLVSKYSPERNSNILSQSATSSRDGWPTGNLPPPSSSSSSGSHVGQYLSSPNMYETTPGTTEAETPRVAEDPLFVVKEAPRALQGLGISRQTSDEFRGVRKGSPILQLKADEDFNKSRRSSKALDTNPSTPTSNRGSLKLISAEKVANMPEARSSGTSLSKLTSASITSSADFDMMVQGNDTIKYTLTPESARETPNSVFHPQVRIAASRSKGSRESITSLVTGKKQPPPPIDTDVVGPRPLRSVAPGPATAPLPKDKNKHATRPRQSSINRPATRNAKPTAAGILAREPTVQTLSTRDFADFIRTTGPDKEQDPFIPLLASRSSQSLRLLAKSHSQPGERSRSYSSASMGKAPLGIENIPPVPAMPSNIAATSSPRMGSPAGIRTQLKPRGPTSTAGGDGNSSDLIDFIRNGPHEQGVNRIPRSVAPFRNTMDSDELKLLNDQLDTGKQPDLDTKSRGPGSGINVLGNTGVTVQSIHRPNTASISSQTQSPRSSTNSQARLLPAPSSAGATAQPAYSSPPARLGVPGVPAGMVERKRHRNKDPYPIDDSEDDDLLTALPRDRRPEESLMDFLRNSEPPKSNAPKPLAAAGQAQARDMLTKARANSINSLRAATSTPVSADGNGKAPMSPTMPTLVSSLQTSSSPILFNGNRRGSDVPSGPPSIAPSMTSNSTTRPAHITAQVSSAGSVPRNMNRPKPELRGAGDARTTARIGAYEKGGTGTGDLADFFRSSGPSAPPAPTKPFIIDSAPAPIVGRTGQKIEKKKGGKFWKRKTYTDLP